MATQPNENAPRLSVDLVDAASIAAGSSTVILVEGASDQAAVETLARRTNLDLLQHQIAVVPIGGAMNIGHFLDRVRDTKVRIGGLVDVGEEHRFRQALERSGFGPIDSRAALESVGFFVCVDDLEDELIRAIGASAVEDLIAGAGDAAPLHTFQRQPEWRDRPAEAQLRRWFGSKSGRKLRYATLLTEALDLRSVPSPLGGVLAHARPISA